MRTRCIVSLSFVAGVALAALGCSAALRPAVAPRAPGAASTAGEAADPASAPGVPDDEIGLDKTDVREISTPAPTAFDDSAPGERPVLPRAYEGSPPKISHGIEDFLPITTDDNMCITCHGVDEKLEGEPTPIPTSHYIDLRGAPDTVGSDVVGARWVCTSCHVAQTGAQPLVGNRFGR